MMLYGSLQIKKNIFYLFSAMIFVIVMTGCFEKQEAKGPTSTSSTATPTPVPTPVINYDYELEIKLTFPDMQSQFLGNDFIAFEGKSNKIPELNELILWSFEDLNNPGDISTGVLNTVMGKDNVFTPQPKSIPIPYPYSGIGRGYPLSYVIRATLTADNKIDFTELLIQQDNLAELRQEYNDFDVGSVPVIGDFDQEEPTGLGKLLLQRGNDKKHGVCARHNYWIVNDLWSKASEIYTYLDIFQSIKLRITSGYRCPAGNKRIGSSARRSLHLFGKAFDWNQQSSRGNWEIANFLIKNKDTYNPSRIYLYDQNVPAKMYRYDSEQNINEIPDDYSEKPEGIIYTHGHVDWYYGWDKN